MPRKVRELFNGGIYHVYNRGNNKQKLFWEHEDYTFFLDKLIELKEIFLVEIFHYCLMSNHYHLLVRIRQGKDLPVIMHRLQLGYARYHKKKYKHTGHIFQERYRSPQIPTESYYLQCGRYIERNPVKAKMVTEASDYEYSSAAFYCEGIPNPIVTPNLYYEAMGKLSVERQSNYRDFVKLEDPYSAMIDRSLAKV